MLFWFIVLFVVWSLIYSLWGEDGQQRLELINLCVLNANALGTETLKNLVLPGIGQFTLVDDRTVTNADLGNNFFLTAASVGKNIAAETKTYLHELNSFVESSNHVERVCFSQIR